ncbi:MAG: hypothetical protein OEL76_10720 [Siculibacillus sp.]|nr:hypothetical protein [Siculibacillus sp.]
MNPFAFADFRAHLAEAVGCIAPAPEPARSAPVVVALHVEWHDAAGRHVAVLHSLGAAERVPAGAVLHSLAAAGGVPPGGVARLDLQSGSIWCQRVPTGWVMSHPAVLDGAEGEPTDGPGEDSRPRGAFSLLEAECRAPGFDGEPRGAVDARIAAGVFVPVGTLMSDHERVVRSIMAAIEDDSSRPLWVARAPRHSFMVDPAAARWAAVFGCHEGRVFTTLAEVVAAVDPSPAKPTRRAITIRLRSWEPGDDTFVDLDFTPEPVEKSDGSWREPTSLEVDEQAAAFARAVIDAWCRGREAAVLDKAALAAIEEGTDYFGRERILAGLRCYRIIHEPGKPFVRRATAHRSAE